MLRRHFPSTVGQAGVIFGPHPGPESGTGAFCCGGSSISTSWFLHSKTRGGDQSS